MASRSGPAPGPPYLGGSAGGAGPGAASPYSDWCSEIRGRAEGIIEAGGSLESRRPSALALTIIGGGSGASTSLASAGEAVSKTRARVSALLERHGESISLLEERCQGLSLRAEHLTSQLSDPWLGLGARLAAVDTQHAASVKRLRVLETASDALAQVVAFTDAAQEVQVHMGRGELASAVSAYAGVVRLSPLSPASVWPPTIASAL